MTPKLRHAVLIALIAFCAGLAGASVGRTVIPAPAPPPAELHDFLHNHLDLDAGQHARLETLESGFAVQKRKIEGQLTSSATVATR